MNLYNPQGWVDFVELLVIGAVFSAPAWITAWRQRSMNRELSNGHPNPLRKDLDTVKDGVSAGLAKMEDRFNGLTRDVRGVREDIGGLRGELREERQARADGDRDLGDRVDKLAQQRPTI